MLRTWIRDSGHSLFRRFGLHLVRSTSPDELAALLRTLHPLDSGIELIRLGPDGDGGYLLPDDLAGIEYCFSPGVAGESGFEADLAARGMKVHLADLSVDGPAETNPSFTFVKKHVGCVDEGAVMTLDGWTAATIGDQSGDLLLQMDIEGAELETLLATSVELLARFRIMIVEFHHLDQLWQEPVFRLYSRVFERVLHTHRVVHIHPNNCCGAVGGRGLVIPRVAEFTFYRKDRFRTSSHRRTFPHPLDRDNTSKPPLVLPRCWYRQPDLLTGRRRSR